MTEAEYLDTIADITQDKEDLQFILKYQNACNKAKELYAKNKNAKVGDEIVCPACFKKFTKKSYQQVFDNTKCKDRYWNYVDIKRYIRMLER